MAKFYAVKNGRQVGIFDNWEQCRAQVEGYSFAEYKSFTGREDALAYLGADAQLSLLDAPEVGANTAVAYVDGSYNTKTEEYGCGVIIFSGGAEHTFSRAFADPDNAVMRNVAGEIEGAKLAMRWCADNNIEEIDIYYDYEGIEKWCTGKWKTNKAGTAEYRKFYDEISKRVRVSFNKVKGHSGDRYNDMADRLAKEAVGIL